MKAAVYRKYGAPEVVQVEEINKPIPKEKEVLIKVVASTVNRTDAGFRSAEYVISRFWSGLFRPKYPVLGSEFSGVIEELGVGVTQFQIGDYVFGYNDKSFGGHAEFLTIHEDLALSKIPTNLSLIESAALTEGAHYALNNIRTSKVTPGQHVLVYGATGAIGSAAVQILKALQAHVTAVCPTDYVDLVRTLGADEVIDYQTQDFTQVVTRFDFIFDAVGKSSFKQCKPLLKEKGIYISTELGKRGINVFLGLIAPLKKGKKVLFPIPIMNKEMTVYLKELAETGAFKPVIDRSYSLDQIVEAYRYVATGQKVGNVIVTVQELAESIIKDNQNLPTCCVTACERPLDQDYWNTQWLNAQTGWDIGYATPAITQYIDGIEDKHAKILIPGCGSAYEAEYLVEKGFQNITLIDIAPEAVAKLQDKFKVKSQVTVLQGDFFEHTEQYDFIIEQTFFCALPPFLRPKYMWKMHQLLKSNGKIFGLLFNRQFSASPPFGGSKEEYEVLFKGAFQFEPLQTAQGSIPQRAGSELFIELKKVDSVVVEMYAFAGITCNDCMTTVQEKISQLDGVLNVQMSSDYTTVLVVSEKAVELQDLRNAIAYDAKYGIEHFI